MIEKKSILNRFGTSKKLSTSQKSRPLNCCLPEPDPRHSESSKIKCITVHVKQPYQQLDRSAKRVAARSPFYPSREGQKHPSVSNPNWKKESLRGAASGSFTRSATADNLDEAAGTENGQGTRLLQLTTTRSNASLYTVCVAVQQSQQHHDIARCSHQAHPSQADATKLAQAPVQRAQGGGARLAWSTRTLS